MAKDRIYDVRVDDIGDVSESGLNVRHRDIAVGIEDLARSIEKHGLIQPIVLRGQYGEPPYDLVIGQRRLLAHKLRNWKTIQARFRRPDYGDFDAQVESLVENLQRVKLNHADTAEAMTMMYNRLGHSVRHVAEELGVSEGTVRDYLAIDRLASPKAKKLLREGKVTKEDVKRVIKAAQGNMAKADRLLDYLPDMTRYDKDRMAKYGEEHPRAPDKQIVAEARKPRYEPSLILSLAPDIDKALDKAAREMDMDKSAVAGEAISDWLRERGFLSV